MGLGEARAVLEQTIEPAAELAAKSGQVVIAELIDDDQLRPALAVARCHQSRPKQRQKQDSSDQARYCIARCWPGRCDASKEHWITDKSNCVIP